MVIPVSPEHISPPEIARVRSVIATFQDGHASSILVTRSAAFTLVRPEALRPVVIEH